MTRPEQTRPDEAVPGEAGPIRVFFSVIWGG